MVEKCNAEVTKIVGLPFYLHGLWWLPVEYICNELESKTNLMCVSKQEALEVKPGHKFTI